MNGSPAHRFDPWLVVAAALVAGGLAPNAPWEVASGASAVLALVVVATMRTMRRRPRDAPGGSGGLLLVALAAAAVLAGALRSRSAVARHLADRARADAELPSPATCSAHARVVASPVRQGRDIRWDGWIDNLTCGDRSVAWAGRATLYGGPADLARGDEADIVAVLAAPQRLWNASSGDPRFGEARRGVVRSGGVLDVRVRRRAAGVLACLDRVRSRVRGRIEATFAPDIAPMVRALVLGESDLPVDDDLAFRTSGLSHLLAVSGMHLVLVLTFTVRAVQGLLSRVERVSAAFDVGRLAAAAGVPVAWTYAELAGAGGSTVRAAWMMTASLSARAIGRRADPSRAFALSLGAMALGDPLVAYDLSFALSAAATAGLLAFAGGLTERLASAVPRWCSPATSAVATAVAASVPCTPIIARFAPSVPLGSVPANLLAVPLGECVALPLCFVHAALAWWPSAERGSAVLASGALVVVRGIARAFSVPALTMDVPPPTSWQLAVLAATFAAAVLLTRGRLPVVATALAALIALEAAARREGCPLGVLRVTFLDVGQGDSALVDLPTGEAVLIDGGGLVGSPVDIGARVVAPELRGRRRRALSAVVLTHPHPDHFGGLASGLDSVRVGALWDTGEGEAEQVGGAYAAVVARVRARGAPVLRPAQLCGVHWMGGARFDVLAPCPDFSSDRGPNDNSFVLRVSFGVRAVLFAGDAEREEEQIVTATARDALRADVLKVGHHGSRTSSGAAFLAAVAPREAVISVGSRNRFGHPSAATLAALTAAGARVWRTDRDGAVTVVTDGRSLEVRGMAPER